MRLIEPVIVVAALLCALPFRPWAPLRAPSLRTPWIAALVILPIGFGEAFLTGALTAIFVAFRPNGC